MNINHRGSSHNASPVLWILLVPSEDERWELDHSALAREMAHSGDQELEEDPFPSQWVSEGKGMLEPHRSIKCTYRDARHAFFLLHLQ